MFDFLDGEFERDDIDAVTVLESLPRATGIGDYSMVWWARPPGGRPPPTETVGLTLLGLHHVQNSEPAQAIVFAFLALMPRLAQLRRAQPGNPEQPRQLTLSAGSSLVSEFGADIPGFPPLPSSFLFELMSREPGTRGARASMSGEVWEREIPREVRRFAQVRSMADYVSAAVELVYRAPPELPSAAPSPLGLVASLDYLDTVWRLAAGAGGKHLFEIHSVQRAAQLAFQAQTENEFESRLTGLGEILRSVRVPPAPTTKQARDKPLNALADHLVSLLPSSEGRLRLAIDTLQAVIDVRDAGQHSAVRSKGARALIAFGVGYPPASWPAAWDVVAARTIEALDAIREELSALAA